MLYLLAIKYWPLLKGMFLENSDFSDFRLLQFWINNMSKLAFSLCQRTENYIFSFINIYLYLGLFTQK